MPNTQDNTIYIDFEYDLEDIATKKERNLMVDVMVKAMHPGFHLMNIGDKVDIIDDANRAVVDLYQHFAEAILRQVLTDQRLELKARAEKARDVEGITGMVMPFRDWGEAVDTLIAVRDYKDPVVESLLYILKEMSPVA